MSGKKAGASGSQSHTGGAPSSSSSSSDATVIVHIPLSAENRRLLAENSERIAKLQRHGTTVTRFEDSKTEATFSISGSKAAVGETKRAIAKIFSLDVTETIAVPKEHHEALNSKTLEKISNETMAKVELPTDSSSADVRITGSREEIAHAKMLINEVVSKSVSNSLDIVTIDHRYHGLIAGHAGENLRAIEVRTNTRITLPRASGSASALVSSDISIRGHPESTAQAKAHLLEAYRKLQAVAGSYELHVAKDAHKLLAGAKNQGIQELVKASGGAAVEVPADSNKSTTIVVRGTHDQILRACDLILQKTDHLRRELTVPKHQHRIVCGPKNARLRELEHLLPGLTVHLPTAAAPEVFVLEGKSAAVSEAFERLQELLGNIERVVLEIPGENHSYISGKNGANLHHLRETYAVTIIMPSGKQDANRIVVEGVAEEGLGHVVSEIKSLSAKKDALPISSVISIPSEFHSHLIGPKRSRVNQIQQETNTKITFPDIETSDPKITIEGARPDIERAKARLLHFVEDKKNQPLVVEKTVALGISRFVSEKTADLAEECSVTATWSNLYGTEGESMVRIKGQKENIDQYAQKLQQVVDRTTVKTVTIPEKNRSFIIGAKGARIQKLMADHDVFINVKKDESHDAAAPAKDAAASGKDGNKKKDGAAKGASTSESEGSVGEVTIVGFSDKVAAAAKDVLAANEERNNMPVDETYTLSPVNQHLFFVSDSALKKSIETATGVELHFPPLNKNKDQIRMWGPPTGLVKARKMLDSLVPTIVTLDIPLPASEHAFLIGPNGARIEEIRKDLTVAIEFPKAAKSKKAKEGKDSKDDAAKDDAAAEEGAAKEEKTEKKKEKQAAAATEEGAAGAAGGGGGKAAYGPFADIKPDTVRLFGVKADVEKAKARILAKITEKADIVAVNDTYQLSKQNQRLFFFLDSALKRNIEKETGVELHIPPLNNNNETVKLWGPVNANAKAKKLLDAAVAGFVQVDVAIPANAYSFIIGPGGSRLEEIRKNYVVIIEFPKSSSASSSAAAGGKKGGKGDKKDKDGKDAKKDKDAEESPESPATPVAAAAAAPSANDVKDGTVRLYGPKADVDKTKARLLELVAEKDDVLRIYDQFKVPKEQQRLFGASDFALKKSIEQRAGVELHFPPLSSKNDQVKVHGSANQIKRAKELIDETLADIVTVDLTIPAANHSNIIGPNGAKIEEIRKGLAVVINFPERKGGKKQQQQAKKNKDGKDGKDGKKDDAEKAEGDGKGKDAADDEAEEDGEAENKANAEDVDEGLNKDTIRLVGVKADVEKAKKRIQAVPIVMNVDIPHDVHRLLVGSEGRGVRRLAEQLKTEISFPPASSNKTAVRLYGAPEHLDKAKAKLQALAASVVKAELEIPAIQMAYLLSKSAKALRDLETQHGVLISSANRKKPAGKGKGKQEKGKGKGAAADDKDAAAAATEDNTTTAAAAASDDKEAADDEDAVVEEDAPPVKLTIQGFRGEVPTVEKILQGWGHDSVLLEPELHRHLIGAKGVRIQAISSQFSCDIQMPRSGSKKANVISIFGGKKEVAACKAYLSEFISKLHDAEKNRTERAERAKAAAAAAGENGDAAAAEGGADLLDNPFSGSSSSAVKRSDSFEELQRDIERKVKAGMDQGSHYGPSSSAAAARKNQQPREIDVRDIRWPKIGNEDQDSPKKGGESKAPSWPIKSKPAAAAASGANGTASPKSKK